MSYLYVIAHPLGWRKVGRADNPVNRLRQHQGHSGAPLSGEAIFPCSDAKSAERSALKSLAPFRIMGEWFNVDAQTAINAVSVAAGTAPEPFPLRTTKTATNPIVLDSWASRADRILSRLRLQDPSITISQMYYRLAGDDVGLWCDELPGRWKPGADLGPLKQVMLRSAAIFERKGL